MSSPQKQQNAQNVRIREDSTRPVQASDHQPTTAVNARALRLFCNRLAELFSRMECNIEFGRITIEQGFEEGRAVGLARTTVEYRDKL